MTQPNDDTMAILVGRTERLIGALTDALVTTAEVAAERIELAARAAQVNQRMAAFASVLEAVGVQKAALVARMDGAAEPMRRLLGRPVEILTAQELAILERAGAPPQAARLAVESVDGGDQGGGEAGGRVYVRDGRRFARLGAAAAPAANGTANGTAAPPAAGA